MMKNKSSIAALCGAITLSFVGMAPAMTVIFSDDFEDGDASDWGGGPYSNTGGGAGPNADSPTQTQSITSPFNGTASGYTMDTVMFDRATNPSWAGTQVWSPTIAGSEFAGSAPSDVDMGFTFAVTADAGPSSSVRFELREVGGITTHAFSYFVSDINGGIDGYSFNLANNQTPDFVTRGTGFDTSIDHRIYVQIQDPWALTGSTRDIGITMDDFFLTTAIPEASSSLLGLFGMALLVARRRR